MKHLKQLKSFALCLDIIMIIFGLLLVIFPLLTLQLLSFIVGICAVAAGISNIIGYFSKYDMERFYRMSLASGIILCVLGIFLMARSYLVVDMIVIVLGLLIFFKNVIRLPGVFELKAAGEKKWWIPFIFNILLCGLGIVMFVLPISFERLVIILTGIAFIVDGISEVIWILNFSKKIKTELKNKNKSSHYINTYAEEHDDK